LVTGGNVFVVMMKYLVEFELDDPRVEAHRRFLRDQAAAGRVVVSGPRVPRVGGLTVFNVPTTEELHELLQQDPMRQARMIEDEIVEFVATVAADEQLLDPSLASS
jgi:uncharacterized protein YciI